MSVHAKTTSFFSFTLLFRPLKNRQQSKNNPNFSSFSFANTTSTTRITNSVPFVHLFHSPANRTIVTSTQQLHICNSLLFLQFATPAAPPLQSPFLLPLQNQEHLSPPTTAASVHPTNLPSHYSAQLRNQFHRTPSTVYLLSLDPPLSFSVNPTNAAHLQYPFLRPSSPVDSSLLSVHHSGHPFLIHLHPQSSSPPLLFSIRQPSHPPHFTC